MDDSLKCSFYSSSSDDEEQTQPTRLDEHVEPCSSKEKQGWLEMASERLKRAGNIISLKSEKSKTELKNKWWGTWNSLKYSDKWQSDQSRDYDRKGAICLLAMFYAPDGEEGVPSKSFNDFIKDYYSKIWITYRTGLTPFEGTEMTSDCGWGCMLRCAQMMTAQAIICKGRLTRNWRFRGRKPSILKRFKEETDPELPVIVHSFDDEHFSIIKLFEDSLEAPLGIHRLVSLVDEGKEAVGRWYRASEAVSLMKRALSSTASPLTSDLAVLLCVDGHLKMGEAERQSKNWTKKLLLVVTLRLGTAEINKVYYHHLKVLFSMSSCLGMLGGRPDHSLYFVGVYNKEILYLDPHVAHQYVPLTKEHMEKKKHPLSSYHCKYLSKMPFYEMDPSCAVGFLVQTHQDLEDTVKDLNLHQVIDVNLGEGEGEKRTRDPLFVVIYGEESNPRTTSQPTEEEKDVAREHGFELL